ncbi:hypothetical protein Tco_0981360 [Tanacetum coccineum]
MEIYSASVVDIAVHFCFLDDQLTSFSPKNCALPDVLFLESWQPAWSASAKAIRLKPVNLGYHRPILMVPFRDINNITFFKTILFEITIADLEGIGLERLKVQYNNDVELEYHVCQIKAAVLSEAHWNRDEGDVSKPISFERHMSKSTKPHPCFYNNDYTYLVDLNTEEKYTTSINKHDAAIYYKEGIEDRIPER